jgi:hypothetical protein
MSDDWTEKNLEEESYDENCAKCGQANSVTVKVGPMHGGWAEDFTPNCAKCGAPLSPAKVFALISVKPVRKK